MKEKFQADSMRIDKLSSPVRSYLAIGEKLKDEGLTQQEKRDLKDTRVDLFMSFKPTHIQELAEFINEQRNFKS